MKLISWNVNGLRACVTKGFLDYFKEADADIFCIQETKLQEGQIDLDLPGYYQYWNYAEKKGYSGTAVFTKREPLSVSYGLGIPEHDKEGRVITLEFPEFYLVTVYTPNSQNELARLPYRMEWEDAFLSYLNCCSCYELPYLKGFCQVIVCAQSESEKAVIILVPRRQEQDGNVCMRAELLKQGEAVSIREHYVQNDQVRHFSLKGFSGLRAASGRTEALVAFLFQNGDKHVQKLYIIIYDQNSAFINMVHDGLPPCSKV